MTDLARFSRARKHGIAVGLKSRLSERKASGPPEPALDAFIEELSAVVIELNTHVSGKTTAEATRVAMSEALHVADDQVDRWMRHIEGYLQVEARRRRGNLAKSARSLHDAAFPNGLEPIDDTVTAQNNYCRRAVVTLRSPGYQETIAGIELPAAWIDSFAAAIKASDAAANALLSARGDKAAHVGLGREAEATWVDLMVRLRKQVESRAKRGDTEKQMENQKLLEPLLTALQKLRAEDASRATRRKNSQNAGPADESATQPQDGAAEGPSSSSG
jgi:hypothetical protein